MSESLLYHSFHAFHPLQKEIVQLLWKLTVENKQLYSEKVTDKNFAQTCLVICQPNS